MAADNHNQSDSHAAEKGHEQSNTHLEQANLSRLAQEGFSPHGAVALANPASTAEKHLPAVSLHGQPETPHKGGMLEAMGDIVHGAAREVYEHPWQIARDAAIGVAAGAAAVVAGPEIATIAGVGLAVGAIEAHGGFKKVGGELWHGAQNLAHNTEIVASPEGHTAAEQAQAKAGLEQVGAVSAHVAAGVAGGFAGGIGAGALTSALRGSGKAVEETVAAQAGVVAGESVEAGTVAGGTGGGAGGAAAESGAQMSGKIVAATGESVKDSALTQGKLTLAKQSSTGSTHADVHAGKLTKPDGSTEQVYYHASEMTHENTVEANAAATAVRVGKEQAAYKLNRMIGFENSYPESQAVDVKIAGKLQSGWLQEAVGKPFETEMRERALQQFGTTQNMHVDVAKILEADPVLQKQVEQAIAERLVYGDHDIASRNIGVSSSGARNFDMGEGFGTGHVPDLVSYQNNLATIGLQNAFSGRPLSEGLRTTLRNFVNHYDNPAGLQSLEKTGLQEEQAKAVLERSRWLADHGKMPEVNPEINAPTEIEWYQAAERHRR